MVSGPFHDFPDPCNEGGKVPAGFPHQVTRVTPAHTWLSPPHPAPPSHTWSMSPSEELPKRTWAAGMKEKPQNLQGLFFARGWGFHGRAISHEA